MKGFVCKVCGFISIDGAAPEKCPVCGSSSFEQKEDAIKAPVDPGNLTELDKKHIPVIKIVKKCGMIDGGCEDINVKLGEITHPMLPEHSIAHIDFYIDQKYVARVMLTPEKLNPATAIHLKAPATGKLSVVALCNVHGAWINESDI